MQEDTEKLVTTKDLAEAKDEIKAEIKAEIKTEVTALSQRIDQLDEKFTKRMDRSDAQTAKNSQVIERLAIRLVQIEQEMETKADAQRKHDEVMTILDKIMKRFDIYDSERAAAEYTFRQHEAKIENHENRLIALEQKF